MLFQPLLKSLTCSKKQLNKHMKKNLWKTPLKRLKKREEKLAKLLKDKKET